VGVGVLDVLDVAWGFDRPLAGVVRVRVRVPLLFDGISVRSSSDEYSLASILLRAWARNRQGPKWAG
jgi:hypothetical protein